MAKTQANYPASKDVLDTDRIAEQIITSDSYDIIEDAITKMQAEMRRVTSKTGAGTLTSSEGGLIKVSAAAPYTLGLPAASGALTGLEYVIVKTDDTNNLITLDGNASETINGELTYTGLQNQWDWVWIKLDGSNWIILASDCVSCALLTPVKEKNTSAIIRGTALYVSGAAGANVLVGKANNTDSSKIRILGLAHSAISQNGTGNALAHGILHNIDTRADQSGINDETGSTWSAGDLLYVNSNGLLTSTRPISGGIIKAGYSLKGSGVNDDILVFIHENPVDASAASGEDLVLRMGDAIGVNKVLFKDYSNVEVGFVDSDGKADFNELILDTALAAIEGGTGKATITENSFLKGGAGNTYAERTYAEVRSDLGVLESINEDNMISNLDTKVPTQQSVKAYVDGQSYGEVNTASNIGSANAGEVYKQKTGVDFELRKIEAGSNQIDISWYTEGAYSEEEGLTTGNIGGLPIYAANWKAQYFTTVSAHNIKKISLWLRKAGSPADDLDVVIKAADGAHKPTGSALSSGTIAASDVGTEFAWIDCILDTIYDLSDATEYVIELSSPSSIDSNNCYTMGYDADAGEPNGAWEESGNSGSTWTVYVDKDAIFKVYSIGVTYKDQIEIDVNEGNIKLDDLGATDDNTDLNVSTSAHGLMPKLPDVATQFIDGTGAWAILAAGDIPDLSATYQPLDTALTNISALVYVSPSFIKLTAEDVYTVRTLAEVRTDLGLVIGTNVLAEQTIGIGDDNLLEVDGSPADDEYARFTVNGLEGRSVAEAKTDMGFLTDLVDDTTPQLGGQMQSGAHSINFTEQVLTPGVAVAWDLGNSNKATLLPAQNFTVTITAPSGALNAQLIITQDGTGSRVMDEIITQKDEAIATTDVHADTDIIDLTVDIPTGARIRFKTSEADLPDPLVVDTIYWAIRSSENHIQVATTKANAIAGTQVNITDQGTGTHTIQQLVKWISGTLEVLTTDAGAEDVLSLTYKTADKQWYAQLSKDFQ